MNYAMSCRHDHSQCTSRATIFAVLVALLGTVASLHGCGETSITPSGIVSVRVAKALGSRGYDQVRVSVIRRIEEASLRTNTSNWSYSEPFVHRWTQYHLSSRLAQVTPGLATTISLDDGNEVMVRVPAKGAGSVGMFVGDPCIRYDPKWCIYADVFDVKNTLNAALNALAQHGELDYWMLVGDNFYDRYGDLTETFFNGLSAKASSIVNGAVLGNHDFWRDGVPQKRTPSDSLGNGHIQWYAQDAWSAKGDEGKPFNFSVDPASGEICSLSNTFWYNMVGNVAFIGFSNAYSWASQELLFQEACSWAEEEDPALLVLLGHWSDVGFGCADRMDTFDLFERVQTLPGCNALRGRIKFIEGHEHCNRIQVPNVGFLFGSFGFSQGNASCQGEFALPILDTRHRRAKLYYYRMGSLGKKTNYDIIMSCLKTSGHSGCTHLAEVWMDEALPEQNLIIVSV